MKSSIIYFYPPNNENILPNKIFTLRKQKDNAATVSENRKRSSKKAVSKNVNCQGFVNHTVLTKR